MGKDAPTKRSRPQTNPYQVGKPQYTDKRVFSANGDTPKYSEVPGEEITHFLDLVGRVGGCAIFGTTSDGGAFSLTVIVGTTRYREWPHDADGMLRAFHEIADQLS